MMQAAEANQIASEKNDKDLKQCERAIHTAVAKGLFDCKVRYSRDVPHVYDMLKQRGYDLTLEAEESGGRTFVVVCVNWMAAGYNREVRLLAAKAST